MKKNKNHPDCKCRGGFFICIQMNFDLKKASSCFACHEMLS